MPDVDVEAFYDIQTIRRGHVARALRRPVEFSGRLLHPAGERAVRGTVVVHLLGHICGFLVIRPTLRFDSLESSGELDLATLHQLERALWRIDYPLHWHIPGHPPGVTGGVRALMNWVFLDLYEKVRGGHTDPATIAGWALEGPKGCNRLHDMHGMGRLSYPFPVSFGTQYEFADAALGGHPPAADARTAQRMAHRLLRAGLDDQSTEPVDVEDDSDHTYWYLEENQALTLTYGASLDAGLDVLDPDRTQLIEFLALRRATLRCVQRDTQRVLTEQEEVTRARLERWQHIVASTTDDYVLHDRIGRLIEPVRRYNEDQRRLRDLGHLETQVRENLAWFQERIDTAAGWTGGLVGAAVGAAALVISLQDVVRIVLATITGVPTDEVADRYGLLIAGLLVVLVVASFAASLLLIRRISSRLRPFSRWHPDRPEVPARGGRDGSVAGMT